MTVENTEGFKCKIISTGREEVDKRKPCELNPLTIEKLLKWIDAQQIDDMTKQELKKSASKYPHQALGTWRKNYSKHVVNAQVKLRKKPKSKPVQPELGEESMENKNDGKNFNSKKDFNSIKEYFNNEFENPSEDKS